MKKIDNIEISTSKTSLSEAAPPVIHRLDPSQSQKKNTDKTIYCIVLISILGVVSGYLLFSFTGKKEMFKTSFSDQGSMTEVKSVVGSKDTQTFRDSAKGKLEKGSLDGEGTHKLIRSGGESQTVYLTSSVLNLDDFIGKNVRVWGETHAAKKAGWFMDVGRVEILE